MEVNGDQQMFGSSKFFKISSFVFNIRKKLKDNFWVNYPFKFFMNIPLRKSYEYFILLKNFLKVNENSVIIYSMLKLFQMCMNFFE